MAKKTNGTVKSPAEPNKKGNQQRLGNDKPSPIAPAPTQGQTFEQYKQKVFELNTRDYSDTLDYPEKRTKIGTQNGNGGLKK